MKKAILISLIMFSIICAGFVETTPMSAEANETGYNIFLTSKNKKKTFRTQKSYLVDRHVKKISGNHYLKNGKLYKFTREGKREFVYGGGVKQFYYDSGKLCVLNKKSQVLFSGKAPLYYFGYKYWKTQRCNLKVFENNVDKLFFNEDGIGFIRNGKFYAYGSLEFEPLGADGGDDDSYFEKHYFDFVHPKYLVRYTGLKAKNIVDVQPERYMMNVTLFSGKTYHIAPWGFNLDDSGDYNRRTRNVKDYKNAIGRDYIRFSGYKKFNPKGFLESDYYFLTKSHGFEMGQKGGREKSLVIIRNVKKYVQVYFTNIVLKTNNRLYGWGWNDNNVISKSNKGRYSVKHKKLIDRGVKDITSTYYGLFYLKKNGNLYFRGKM